MTFAANAIEVQVPSSIENETEYLGLFLISQYVEFLLTVHFKILSYLALSEILT